MKATHTPGPWTVGTVDRLDIRSEDYGSIGCVHTPYRGGNAWKQDRAIAAANARLIAAAPDMLAALKEMCDDIEARWDMRDRSTNPGIRHCVEQAREAIAKAEDL